MQKPKKWTEIYPQGTKEGDEEQKFFIALSRNEKFEWRSIAMITKESGLTKKRVEELLTKYHKLGLVFQSSTNEENWGYWERVPGMLKDNTKSISDKDQERRVNSSIQEVIDPVMTDKVDSVNSWNLSSAEFYDQNWFAPEISIPLKYDDFNKNLYFNYWVESDKLKIGEIKVKDGLKFTCSITF